jgi:hypothetical protein
MTATRLGLAAVALGVTLSACATMQVSSFVERGADVTKYHTYNWAPPKAQATGDPRLDNNEFFANRIHTAVEEHLNGRGFEKATTGPDLVVHYYASVSQEINLNGSNEAYAMCQDDCEPYVYDAGTIVVDLVDARTNRLVWRGWAEGSIDGAIDNQTVLERQVDDAVARIIARLPRAL